MKQVQENYSAPQTANVSRAWLDWYDWIHTQPRRLAARSVSQRIAEEVGEKLGESIGFKIRFNETRLARFGLSG